LADTQVAWSGVNLVAHVVVPHLGADLGHHASDVVPEHKRSLVLQEKLEVAVTNHFV
jgi:hypothetical protein